MRIPNVARVVATVSVLTLALPFAISSRAEAQGTSTGDYKYSDSHFHLTNYVQEGTSVKDYVAMMGNVVKRSTLFGIPLQQMWQFGNTGDYAPTYYLQTDSPLYYYSFSDAFIAMAYRSLPPEQQARLDPMITAFNPADMYAADHIKRVLLTFPGVFTGIGEFSIHKEFVSSKVAGGVATLNDPALHRLLEFAGEVGLVVILHNDVDMPFPKPDQEPYVLVQFKELMLKHPNTTIIWAHAGLGRIVRPVKDQLGILDRALASPGLKHLQIDISWDETAKYITASPETVAATASLIEKYPDRFLFGSDVVAPKSIDSPMAVYNAYEPLWKALRPETVRKVTLENDERIFDEGRRKVRAWEKANAAQSK
jgi:Amidohydrolase